MEICSVFLTKNFQLQFVLEVTANLFSKDKGKMVLTHAAVSIFFSQFIKFQTLSGFFSISNRGGATPPPCRNTGEGVCPLSVTALPTCTKMYYSLPTYYTCTSFSTRWFTKDVLKIKLNWSSRFNLSFSLSDILWFKCYLY